jgi:hypothetical protein
MKSILTRQIIVIPVLYVLAKLLWDSIPVELLPDILSGILSDLFGPSFIMAIILFAFIYVFWKVPLLRILAKFLFGTKPNIQGTWKGRLEYEWNDKKGEKIVFLSVKQIDGYSIHIRLLTDERISTSVFADIISNNGGQRIFYTYSNEESPDNKEKNPSHEGFCQLDVDETSNILHGIYHTTRKTFGKLSFDNRNRKVVNTYKKAQELFGMKTELL